MKYKPNWPETKERLTALWNHKFIDRPCIAVMAPNGKQWPAPIKIVNNTAKFSVGRRNFRALVAR